MDAAQLWLAIAGHIITLHIQGAYVTNAIDTLLSCPFCGGDDIDPTGCASRVGDGDTIFSPCCNSCSATTDGDWSTRHNPEANALKIAVESLREIEMHSVKNGTEGVSSWAANRSRTALAEIEREANGENV